ncbi:hypothetical protein GIB67_013610 [Kingdonia uniflora]|uniref:Uncharacterized protein n=1 Tax=Kingdonia uniflora TaxID=39325 RepID=A0A7J7NQ58_9MAGN|nr:hypothetical protein GIB67_013610 [Kingdonia uniflora]
MKRSTTSDEDILREFIFLMNNRRFEYYGFYRIVKVVVSVTVAARTNNATVLSKVVFEASSSDNLWETCLLDRLRDIRVGSEVAFEYLTGVEGSWFWRKDFVSSEDFEPALIPEKTIPDPDDKRLENWDERAKIPNPEASMPDDWDEDAPIEIEDAEAEKPEGWLDDEPEEIDDPEASKPEDWDDEEDGAWESPTEQIDNPDYFELEEPDFEPVAAIGIEILTIQNGILFDNILIVADEKVAESYRETTWKPKFEVEKEKQKSEDEATRVSDGPAGFQDVIEKGDKQPNVTIGKGGHRGVKEHFKAFRYNRLRN